jgi:hypothetical protein
MHKLKGNSQTGQLVPPSGAFAEAIAKAIDFALLEIERAAIEQKLSYHTANHAKAVRRRARIIFKALLPFASEILERPVSSNYLCRLSHLIDICAIAHDLVQEFIDNSDIHAPRRRKTGISEAATIAKLFNFMDELDRQFSDTNSGHHTIFSPWDKQIIKESIEATICLPDPASGELYQPALYDSEKPVSLPGRVIALADLGCLGMEGIAAYRQEGRLIVLEENPDIISNLRGREFSLLENTRQRLLKRCHFQLRFAKSRKARFVQEVGGLPAAAIAVLKPDIFKYLTAETIATLEAMTPTNKDTSLEELIEFFDLKSAIASPSG